MRYPVVVALIVFMSQGASPGDHLIPDTDVLVHPDGYKLKIRHVFGQAFEKDVTLRVIVVPSFSDESAAGLCKTDKGIEAFVLEPSSRIWATETLRMYEEGKIRRFGQDGKLVPLQDDAHYREMKRLTPADFRLIKVTRRGRPIPKDLAETIQSIWDAMLLGVRHPAEPGLGADGVTHYFSAWLSERGELSGHVWSPDEDSKTGRFVALADALADYARGKVDLDRLRALVKRAEAP